MRSPSIFLEPSFQSKLLSHHACKEAAHRVLLPAGKPSSRLRWSCRSANEAYRRPDLVSSVARLFLSRAGRLRLDWQWRFGSNRSCCSGYSGAFGSRFRHRDPPSVSGENASPPPKPHLGHRGRRGRIPERVQRPKLTAVPLRLRRNASPFWIILLLELGRCDHGMTLVQINQREWLVLCLFKESWRPS
jgi:hypothetical protein